jgi:hypothetical protein
VTAAASGRGQLQGKWNAVQATADLVAAANGRGDLEGQAGLADAAWTEQRQESNGRRFQRRQEQSPGRGYLPFATDQRCRRDWQGGVQRLRDVVFGVFRCRRRSGEQCGSVRDAELERIGQRA